MVGMVTEPIEAALADADPEIEPKSAEERTATLPAPPRSRPAAAMAIFRKPWPASPTLSTAPMMTQIATIFKETPVNDPHTPPSVIVSVPTVLPKGPAGCANSPGTYRPQTP